MKVEVLTAIPAAGKTKAILEHILESGEKAIIASISRQLSRQSYEYFENLGGDGVIIDADNRHGANSVNTGLIDCVTNGASVLFITHAALLRFTDFEALKGYSLYIDEVPELVTFNRFSFTVSLDQVLPYCEPITGELSVLEDLVLKESCIEEVNKLAIEGAKQRDDVMVTMYPLYKALLQGIPTKIHLTENGAHCYFINDVSTSDWEVFTKITIASANLEDTFTGKVLRHFNGWEFIKSPLTSKLLFTSYPNSSRIQINVMMEQNWSKHSADKEKDGISNYNRMKTIVEGLVDGKDFIYTRNSYRARFTRGQEVPYNPHGLNAYSSYKNVAVMFSFNPLPWQIPLLKDLSKAAGLDEDDLMDAYIVSKYLEPAFQLCARSNIRNSRSNAKVNLFVPDMKLALYMKEHYFPNAAINQDYMIKAPEKSTKRERKSYQSMFDMTQKERYKYMYLLRKLGRKLDVDSTEDYLIVSEWLAKTRSKAKG